MRGRSVLVLVEAGVSGTRAEALACRPERAWGAVALRRSLLVKAGVSLSSTRRPQSRRAGLLRQAAVSAAATAPSASRPVASAGGFSWRDAVIGAGIGFVLALTGAALVLGTRRPAHS